MEFWINEIAPQYFYAFSIYGFALVFLAGIITSIGPCNLTMMPVLMAYVGGKQMGRRKSFAYSLVFTLGTATTFMLLGLFIAAVGGLFGMTQSILYYFVAAVCVVLGLNLVGIFKFDINFGGDFLNRFEGQEGLWGSYSLGMVMGLAGTQCGTPILLAILSIAMASGQIVYGAALLFIYAMGRGIPIIIVGTFTGILSKMEHFAKWSAVLEKVAGVVIIMVGIYFAWLA